MSKKDKQTTKNEHKIAEADDEVSFSKQASTHTPKESREF
jgi:hypothetical protein